MITLTVFILILLILILLIGKLSFSIHRFVNTEPEGVCSSGGERGKQRGKAGPRHFCCQNPFFKSSGLSDLSDVQNSLKIEM